MKYTYLFLVLAISFACSAQKVDFEQSYGQLMNELGQEKWTDASRTCKSLLDFAAKTDSMETEKMVLRYIFIYTHAGLLNEGKISKKTALKKVKHLKGEEMIMPSHPFNANCYVNCTHFSDEQPNTFFSGVNNANGTQIFSFEYVTMKDPIQDSTEVFEGRYITLKGKLNEISVEGNMLPRFRLVFINGEYRIED